MAKNKRLSTWLRSGVIEQNIKDTLKSTLDKLHSICPLNISRTSLRDSLHDNLYHDEAFRQNPAYKIIFNWFEASSQKTRSARPVAIFKKTRLYSSVVGQ
ncbi:hypothetical protein F8M41_009164 [Gigaspora margarita]|uniref:Uncharacterized protein n=1 Tax=Gigaspora margarita TaxID=4874 RepID=A0A8H3X393_GIGMA|nr:hypothetical protein F8M41_009164 [Gigaspora margarita]